MLSPIRLGDPTSHGGAVTSATTPTNLLGKPLAVVGDTCSCPLPGHSGCTIVEGDPHWAIGGKPVALHGHKVSCGATLISTIPNFARG